MDKKVGVSTLLGASALLMWAVEPLLVSEIEGLPLFEILTLVFASSFLITAIRITITRRWKLMFRQPLFVWLIGLIGICGSDFAYFLAADCAPIAHVDLIDYLWPCFVVVFVGLLPKEQFKMRHLIGAGFGLAGILVLITSNNGPIGINTDFMSGYLLAFYGAVLWGAYSAFSRYFQETPSEMVGMYCGLGAIVSFIMHLSFEQTVVPDFNQGSLCIITGMSGAGLAYQLWDYGVKYGNVRLLSSITYLARIGAMGLLVAFGKEPLTMALIFACALACSGVFISSLSDNLIQSLTCAIKTRFQILRSFKRNKPSKLVTTLVESDDKQALKLAA